jgi:hypothetical protein
MLHEKEMLAQQENRDRMLVISRPTKPNSPTIGTPGSRITFISFA